MTAALKPHEVLGQRLRAQTAEALAATHRPEVLARAAAQAMEAAECAFAELQEDASVARKVAGLDCRIAGNEPVGGVWPSDHHAVLAELRY